MSGASPGPWPSSTPSAASPTEAVATPASCSAWPATSPGGEARIAAESAHAVASIPAHGRGLSQAIARAEALLDIPRERALAALADEANRHGAEPECKRATMGFPPACIPACLYFLLATDTFEEALIEIINLGGDADSTGAILGAMAGAHYGVDAIPARWLDGLHNREGIEARLMPSNAAPPPAWPFPTSSPPSTRSRPRRPPVGPT